MKKQICCLVVVIYICFLWAIIFFSFFYVFLIKVGVDRPNGVIQWMPTAFFSYTSTSCWKRWTTMRPIWLCLWTLLHPHLHLQLLSALVSSHRILEASVFIFFLSFVTMINCYGMRMRKALTMEIDLNKCILPLRKIKYTLTHIFCLINLGVRAAYVHLD